MCGKNFDFRRLQIVKVLPRVAFKMASLRNFVLGSGAHKFTRMRNVIE